MNTSPTKQLTGANEAASIMAAARSLELSTTRRHLDIRKRILPIQTVPPRTRDLRQ